MGQRARVELPTGIVDAPFIGDEELEETVLATLTLAGLSDDRAPDGRVRAHDAPATTGAAERMMSALRPLNVSRGDDLTEDLVVLDRLGAGGMGIVERARQQSLDREVAVKRLNDEAGVDPKLGYTLVEEARILGGLGHPNIVPVYAVGVDEALGPVVVLERVHGDVWSRALADDREAMHRDPSVLEKHLRILMQVCNALHFAHSRDILHRDVKPDNVMLGDFGEVYLMDWGVALRLGDLEHLEGLDEQLSLAGTPAYMSPEMVHGDAPAMDARTDVYLAGATLHELLTGKRRHNAQRVAATLIRALQSRPHEYPEEVPAALGDIANRACAAEPSERFETAADLRDAIADYLEEREARALLATASEILDAFDERDERDVEAEEHEQDDRRFHEARFAIEHALRVRPGFDPALHERRRCLTTGIEHAIHHGELRRGRAMAIELGDDLPASLATALEAARTREEAQRERTAALERDVDISVAHRERLRIAWLGLAAMTVSFIAAQFAHPGNGLDLETDGMFVRGGLLSGIILAGLFVQRRRLSLTRLNRQLMRTFGGFALFIVVTRALAYGLDLPPPVVFAVELAGIGLAVLIIEAPLKITTHIGLAALGCAALAAWQPTWARYLHMAFFEVTMIIIVRDITTEQLRMRPDGESS